LRSSGLDPTLVAELSALLDELDDGERVLCHFDLHSENVIVGPDGWVVIDWLSAMSGPSVADFARTVVLRPPGSASPAERFAALVFRDGMAARGLDRERVD